MTPVPAHLVLLEPAGAGWPLQVYNGRPVPYTTRRNVYGAPLWDQIDDDRANECVMNYRCQLCGLDCGDDLHVMTRPKPGETIPPVFPGGPLHLRCARVAMSACPGLKRAAGVEILAVVRSSLDVSFLARPSGPIAWIYVVIGPYKVVSCLRPQEAVCRL